jgi:hypothetical protein
MLPSKSILNKKVNRTKDLYVLLLKGDNLSISTRLLIVSMRLNKKELFLCLIKKDTK